MSDGASPRDALEVEVTPRARALLLACLDPSRPAPTEAVADVIELADERREPAE